MEEKVIKLVLNYIKTKGIIISKCNIFIVWSCYILGNRKYIVGLDCTHTYFEVIYDVQSSKMASDLLDTMTVKLYGKDNVTNKIVVSYQNNDYVLNIY